MPAQQASGRAGSGETAGSRPDRAVTLVDRDAAPGERDAPQSTGRRKRGRSGGRKGAQAGQPGGPKKAAGEAKPPQDAQPGGDLGEAVAPGEAADLVGVPDLDVEAGLDAEASLDAEVGPIDADLADEGLDAAELEDLVDIVTVDLDVEVDVVVVADDDLSDDDVAEDDAADDVGINEGPSGPETAGGAGPEDGTDPERGQLARRQSAPGCHQMGRFDRLSSSPDGSSIVATV